MSGPETATAATLPPSTAEAANELARVLDLYLADLKAGKAPDKAAFLSQHPELASQLEPCLAGLEFIHRAGAPLGDRPAQLGDFRIHREIGRGGMGVVYEAEQLSLKRRVALKVLRFGASPDAEALKRFQREAETVARLHHTNIVPIFAVGCEEGVHYYAMQFIEGTNLADKITQTPRPTPRDVAGWGLQAAEALAYAHQRGIVHRDIKPSNLLLDPEAIVWLTDFGLAKRADEVTLTISGAIMGTPRYMSPEQAAAAQQKPIDHRTDIYSLGASLYELATGRPVFQADSPLLIIGQILMDEPVAPRKYLPEIPRDLETIILKCLAKEPSARYSGARELAQDLRSFLDGRPIAARRASMWEKTRRWVKKHRRTAMIAGTGAVVAVIAIVGGILGYRGYHEARLGRFQVTTDGPPLVAEVLHKDSDERVLPEFTVPTQQHVAVPEGHYRLRLSRKGDLSETYQMLVQRGARTTYHLALGERRLGPGTSLPQNQGTPPTGRPRGFEVATISGHADIIRAQDGELSRIDGPTRKRIWQVKVDHNEVGFLGGFNNWKDSVEGDQQRLVLPVPDLDGDGAGDLVFASRRWTQLLAYSGSDGKLLWKFRGETPLPEGTDAATVKIPFSFSSGTVIGIPATLDVDGDGKPDIIATFMSGGDEYDVFKPGEQFPSTRIKSLPGRWIEAVSGATGKSLWRHGLDDAWFKDEHEAPFPAEVVELQKHPKIVCLAGTHLVAVEPKGRVLASLDLGDRAVQPPRFGDLDRDGHPDAVVLHETVALPGASANVVKDYRLAAWSLQTNRRLWTKQHTGVWLKAERNGAAPAPDWPVVADLGAGEATVLVARFDEQRKWRGVEALDGLTGEIRWQWAPAEGGLISKIDRIAPGPDIDGDGQRDVFVAATVAGPSLLVEAASGKDGKVLWSWRGRISGGAAYGLLLWWQRGNDGFPQLVVPTNHLQDAKRTFILNSGTGTLAHVLEGVPEPMLADFDGDGLPDLHYRFRDEVRFPQGDGERVVGGTDQLYVVRGQAPEQWRRLGWWQAAADFDGDGVTDLVNEPGFEVSIPITISGKDGRVLWKQPHSPSTRWPAADLDGDGVHDLVFMNRRVAVPGSLYALSGKDGRLLWRDSLLSGEQKIERVIMLESRDLDNDGKPEVIVAFVHPGSQADLPRTNDLACELAVLSGNDGKVKWRLELGRVANVSERPFHFAFSDVTGDGIIDVAAVTSATDPQDQKRKHFEVRAYSGKDGSLLWHHRCTCPFIPNENRPQPRIAIGDLDGSGKPLVIVSDYPHLKDPGEDQFLVQALDGPSGKVQWTWRDPEKPANFLQFGETFAPRIVELGGGKRGVSVNGKRTPMEGKLIQLVVLDAAGKLVRRVDLLQSWMDSSKPFPLLSGDLSGDGTTALVAFDGDQVVAHSADLSKVLWKFTFPSGDHPELKEILPAGKDYPATVVVRAGNALLGLDGKTGKARWQGEGRGEPHLLASHGDPEGRPRIVYIDNNYHATVCRQALAK